jgi:4a-hydroxytetrahydrobiopterin dehydratase
MTLRERHCVPCTATTPRISVAEYGRWLQELPGWHVVDDHHLYRRYAFPDFATALAAVEKIAAVAEAEGHHPEITLRWGEVEVRIWTHAIDGLTENDFILAAKCDAAIAPSGT